MTTTPEPGGLERFVADLCHALDDRGWGVSALFPDFVGSGRLREVFRRADVPLVIGPASLSFESALSPPLVVHLARILRAVTPAGGIVHLHYPESFLSVRHIAAVRLARRRCIVSFHGVSDWKAAGERKRRITGVSHRLCDAILTHSSAVRRSARSAGVTERLLRTVPCGVPEPVATPTRAAARAMFGVPEDAFVVATAGRLVAQKHIGDVIQAVQLMPVDIRPTLLLIAGDGPRRILLETLAAGGQNDVRFLGFLTSDTMDAFYAAADVFALPSEREAFGLVYVEAALRSLPSIALAQGGVPDVIQDGETGVLLPRPSDITGLTVALEALRRRPELARALGAAARDYARAHFTLPVVATKIEALYCEMLAKDVIRRRDQDG